MHATWFGFGADDGRDSPEEGLQNCFRSCNRTRLYISCRTISQVLLDLLKVEATHTLTSPTTGFLAPSPRSLAL